MPEIAEVHRIVHYIRQHLVGKTIAKVQAQHDESVFGKVGTSAAEFEKAMTGNKVVGAGQQGKYFWIEMSSPPHPVLHFGMTGWFHIKDQSTYYYRSRTDEKEEWPPKYWKFLLQMKAEGSAAPVEAAYADPRRFGRVRLVDCKGKDLRHTTPLKENGPDPVIDKNLFTEDWLVEKCTSKKVPIKALLLDQANISGIGNWVGDEVLFQSRIHPEQYSNTLSNSQVSALHQAIVNVCTTACDLLADSEQFPETWLFKHRWGKGRKDEPSRLPSGEKILFVTVGGRTSAVVPSIQKKTGPVAQDVDAEDLNAEESNAQDKKRKRGSQADSAKGAMKEETNKDSKASRRSSKQVVDTNGMTKESFKAKGAKLRGSPASVVTKKRIAKPVSPQPGRRRSGRLAK